MRKIAKFLMINMVLASLVLVTGCNTVAGAGKDIQQGGKAIQKAAS